MRTCAEYELLISAFLDGELPEHERAALAEHLTACPRCQRYFDDLVAIHDAFEREEAPVPEDFAGTVMARVRETPQDGPNRVIRLPNWQRWAALAACCAVVALGVWGAKMRTPVPDVVSQTATANGAPSMARSAEADDAGDGAMVMMDEAAIYPEPEAPEEESQKMADSPVDGETGGGAELSYQRETAADKERDAVPAAVYEDDLALAELAPVPAAAPAAAGIPEGGGIAAGGPAARAWVEETLGLAWEIGRTYPLTEEEYTGLLETLTAAGEDFRQEPGEARQLLAVEWDA